MNMLDKYESAMRNYCEFDANKLNKWMCAVCSARPLSQMIFMSSSTCRSEANKSTPLCVRFLFNYIISFDLMIFEAFVFPSRRVDNSGEESQIAHTSVAMHTESHGTFCSSFESHTRIDVMSMENMRRSNCVRCDFVCTQQEANAAHSFEFRATFYMQHEIL